MTDGDQKSNIYPDYCHELSPTIGRWCPLRAVDVHALQSVGMFDNGKEIYHHGNHPIKWVRLTGVIISIDDFPTRRILTLDDSSGMCIECTCPAPIPAQFDQGTVANLIISTSAATVQTHNPAQAEQGSTPTVQTPSIPWEDIDIGTVVKIKGKPGRFWDVKQVDIIKVEVLRCTEQEVRCWNEVLSFRKEVLRVPWVVSPEAEVKCRKRAEKEKQYKSSSRKHGSKAHKSRGVGEDKSKDKNAMGRRKGDESDGKTEKREERHDEKKRKHEREGEGLNPENKVNYPSWTVRRRLARKYDALGI